MHFTSSNSKSKLNYRIPIKIKDNQKIYLYIISISKQFEGL